MDEIQEGLLRAFPGELAAGEARMYAHGWTVSVVREGLQALAAEDGLEWSGLQDTDVTRWLRGEVYPRESLERLCRLFRCHQSQLGWPPRGNDVPVSFGPPAPRPAAALVSVPQPSDRRDWAAWFGTALSRLIALVESWDAARSSEALQALVHQEVLMFDAVRPARDEGHDFDPSRRQLLITLLALPGALSLGTASTVLVRRLLTHCATSIAAAWHLLKQSDLAIVEQQVSGYVLALGALAHQSTVHQAEAARLASQAHRVLGIVALHRRQFQVVDQHLRTALHYSEIARDSALQTSVLLAATGTTVIHREDPIAVEENHQRLLHREPQLAPLQRARLHSQLAIQFAMKGEERQAVRHLGLAEAAYPASVQDDPSFARQDFSPGQFVLYRGLAQLALARAYPDRQYQRQASYTFDQVGTLVGPAAVAERVRVEIINHQADTALEMRELERFVDHLRSGVDGARGLNSALRLHEATTSWRRALEVWPTERRVTELAELFTDGTNVHPAAVPRGGRSHCDPQGRISG